MLRMVLLGLLIPLGVGVLAAMELRTPPRNAAMAVQPVAELTTGISEPRGALAKADRLEAAAAGSETPAPPAPVDERISPPEDISVGSSVPPMVTNPQRRDTKSKKVTTAAPPRPKPRTADVKRPTISERRKAAGTESCRLGAFGGLRRALGSADCEI